VTVPYFAEYFRALPFVKEVRRFDPEASSIYVENLSGGTIGVTLPSEAGAASIRKTMTRETVVEWLERECRGLESSLQADLCVFSYEKGLMTTLSSRKAGEVLPMVVQTLTSSKTEDEKFQALELYGLTDPQNRKVCEGLVKDFRPSQQLQDRIGGLRKKIPCVLPVPSPEEHDAMVRQALATPGTLEQKRAAFNRLLEAKRPVLRDAEPASRPTSQ